MPPGTAGASEFAHHHKWFSSSGAYVGTYHSTDGDKQFDVVALTDGSLRVHSEGPLAAPADDTATVAPGPDEKGASPDVLPPPPPTPAASDGGAMLLAPTDQTDVFVSDDVDVSFLRNADLNEIVGCRCKTSVEEVLYIKERGSVAPPMPPPSSGAVAETKGAAGAGGGAGAKRHSIMAGGGGSSAAAAAAKAGEFASLLTQLLHAKDTATEADAIQKLSAFPVSVLPSAWLLTATTCSDTTLAALLDTFARHLTTGAVPLSFFLGLFVSMRKARRFTALEEASLRATDVLVQDIVSSAVQRGTSQRSAHLQALEAVLLGYQHQPLLLEKAQGVLIQLLQEEGEAKPESNQLKKSKSLSAVMAAAAAAASTSTSDDAQLSDRYRVIQLCYVLSHMFPGSTSVVELNKTLSQYPELQKLAPNAARVRRVVADHQWLFPGPLVKGWPEGSYSSNHGDMKWRMLANVSGRRLAGGYRQKQPREPALGLGDRAILRWDADGQYWAGTLRDSWHGQFSFRCAKGSKWVHIRDLFIDEPISRHAAIGSRVLARPDKQAYYVPGLIVGKPSSSSFTIAFDQGGADATVAVSHLRVLRPAGIRTSGHFEQGSLQGVLYSDHASQAVFAGTWQPLVSSSKGYVSLTMGPDGQSFSGYYTFGEEQGVWMGVKSRVLQSLAAPDGSERHGTLTMHSFLPRLNGKGDCLVVHGAEETLSISGSQSYTLEAMVRLEHGKGMAAFIAKSDLLPKGGPPDYLLGVAGGRLFLQSPTIPVLSGKLPALPIGVFAHVAASFDGSTGKAKLYVNGALAAEVQPKRVDKANLTVPVLLGASLSRGVRTNFLAGNLSEVRIWRRALSLEELTTYAGRRLQGIEADLAAYWPLYSRFLLAADLTPAEHHAMFQRTSFALAAAPNEETKQSTPPLVGWEPVSQLEYPVIGHLHTFHGDLALAGNAYVRNNRLVMATSGLSAAWSAGRVALDGDLQTSMTVNLPSSMYVAPVSVSICVQAGSLWTLGPPVSRQHDSSGITCTPRSACVEVSFEGTSFSARVFTIDGQGQETAVVSCSGAIPVPHPTTPKATNNRRNVQVSISASSSVMSLHLEQKPVLSWSMKLGEVVCPYGGGAFVGLLTAEHVQAGKQPTESEVELLQWVLASKPASSSAPMRRRSNSGEMKGADASTLQESDATALVPRANAVGALVQLLLDLEGGLKSDAHSFSWKVARERWLRRAAGTAGSASSSEDANTGFGATSLSTVTEFATLLLMFSKSVNVPSKEWPFESRDAWEQKVQQAQRVSQVVDLLLELRSKIPEDSFIITWQQQKAEAFESALRHLQELDVQSHRKSIALELSKNGADDGGGGQKWPLTACIAALEAKQDNYQAAVAYLQQRGRFILNQDHNHKYIDATQELWSGQNALSAQTYPAPDAQVTLEGLWDTNRGELSLSDQGSFSGKTIMATYANKNGVLSGLLWRNAMGKWLCSGSWSQSDSPILQPCDIEFTPDGSKLVGHWYSGDRIGNWRGTAQEPVLLQRQKLGHSGLINIGNTCYQNSILQSLYMTSELRTKILSVAPPGPAELPKGKGKGKKNKKKQVQEETPTGDDDEEEEPSVSESTRPEASAPPPPPPRRPAPAEATRDPVAEWVQTAKEEAKQLKPELVVTRQFQRLFACLHASLRPSVDQRALKTIAMNPYNGRVQQDSMQYGQYILEQLSAGLKDTPLKDLPAAVFGGTIKSVIRCEDCGAKRALPEAFVDLGISLPKSFAPITDVVIISGSTPNLAPPDGYDRVSENLNAGRRKAVWTYVCVQREAGVVPITDIAFVHSKEEEKDKLQAPKGFQLVDGNVNEGGDGAYAHIRLCIQRHPDASPITMLTTAKGEKVPDGFERIEADLNGGSGNTKLYMCVKRDLPIRQLTIVSAPSLHKALEQCPSGFTLIRTNINLPEPTRTGMHGDDDSEPEDSVLTEVTDHSGAGGDDDDNSRSNKPLHHYICYSSGGTKQPITDIKLVSVAAGDVGPPKVDNEETQSVLELPTAGRGHHHHHHHLHQQRHGGGARHFLFITRGQGSPALTMDVFRAPHVPPRYGGHGLVNLAPEAKSQASLYDRRWALDTGAVVTWQDEYESPEFEALVVEGPYSVPGGHISGVMYRQLNLEEAGDGRPGPWILMGTWKKKGYTHPQSLQWKFTDDSFSAFKGSWNDGKRSGQWNGQKVANASAQLQGPITGIAVIWKGKEKVPPGYTMIESTVGGRSGNLNNGVKGAPDLRICIQRNGDSGDGPDASVAPIESVGVLWAGIGAPSKGFEVLEKTPSGRSANLNEGSGAHTLFLAIKRTKYGQNALLDLSLAHRKDNVPPGWRKITQSFIGLEGNLNAPSAGNDLHLMMQSGKAVTVEHQIRNVHPAEGTYSTTSGTWTCSVTRRCRARFVSAIVLEAHARAQAESKIDDDDDVSDDDVLHIPQDGGHMEGVLMEQKDGWRLLGTYDPTGKWEYPGSIDLTFDKQLNSCSGRFARGKLGGPLKGYKDSFVTLGFTPDTRSHWDKGKEVFSAATFSNKVGDLLQQHFSAEGLRGDNRVSCGPCGQRTNAHRFTCMYKAPSHLLLTIKRFNIDYRTMEVTKLLQEVELEPTVSLPVPDEEFDEVLFPPQEEKKQESEADAEAPTTREALLNNRYGLYAIVVHSGSQLQGGHYFTYARPSDSNLALLDDPEAPWVLYDDNKLSEITWRSIVDRTRKSIAETAYLLLYRRIETKANEQTQAQAQAQAPTQTQPLLMPESLQQSVWRDNSNFVFGTLASETSVHYLQELHASARKDLNYTGPFAVTIQQHHDEDGDDEDEDEQPATASTATAMAMATTQKA